MGQPRTMKLELSTQEVNTVLAALGKAPYEMVYELISKIHSQAQQQDTE